MRKASMAGIVVLALLGVLFDSLAATAQGPQPARPAAGLGTGFTYQGRLVKNGAPVSDACNLAVSVWDSQFNLGGQVGANQTINGVGVANGLFTVILNGGGEFGPNAFTGQERWLQIAAQCTGDGSPVALSRQPITAAPYALYAAAATTATLALSANNAPWAGLSGVPAGFADGIDNDTLATLSCGGSGYVATWNGSAWGCAAPAASTYSAGSGLALNGSQFYVVTGTIQARVSGNCATGQYVRAVNQDGTVVCGVDLNSGGTLTGVIAGLGLSGGGVTGTVALGVVSTTVQLRVSGNCTAGAAVSAVNADGSVVCSTPGRSSGYYPLGSPQALDMAAFDSGLIGFAAGFTDGRYVYFAPNANGKLARLDPQNFSAGGLSVLNLAAVDSSLLYFAGGFSDGRYGYLAPNFNGKTARVDLQNFTTGGVTTLYLTAIDTALTGFQGGFTDGRYGYYVPGTNGKVARVDLLNFAPSGVITLDLTALDGSLKGFRGGFTDGRYGYLVPGNNGAPAGKVARLDLQNFTGGGVSVLDLGAADTALKGFQGGFTDGRYAYFVPDNNGSLSGKIARVDTLNFASGGVSSLDLAAVDSGLKGFRGGFSDGRYGYFVPYNNGGPSGKVARVDLNNFTASGVSVFDFAAVDGALSGFWGGVSDGRFGYFVPNNNGAPSGKVARIPLLSGGGY